MAPEARLAQGRRWLLILAGYAVLLAASFDFAARSSLGYWVSNALLATMGLLAVAAADLPLEFFGITLRGGLASLWSAAASTFLLLAGGGLLLLLVRSGGEGGAAAAGIGPEMAAYLLVSVPLQEFVFRGVFQSSARFVLGEGRRARCLAVALSTAAYCAIHLPWGAPAALLVLVPGLVWGIQFERDRSLLGVTVSHVVVGYVYLGALPLWTLVAA